MYTRSEVYRVTKQVIEEGVQLFLIISFLSYSFKHHLLQLLETVSLYTMTLYLLLEQKGCSSCAVPL